MTPLLDRYLAAIARELPKAQAADITAELRDNLLSEIEEKQACLGRPLNRKELEALLIDFGHPLVIAARYRKTQYLIGPEIFPFWLATLRVVLAVAVAIYLAGLVIRLAAAHEPLTDALPQSLQTIWPGLFMVFGAVTAVFAIMERLDGRAALMRWSPRQLPPVRSPRPKRFDVAARMAMAVVFVLWWTGLIHFRDIAHTPLRVDLAPIFATLYWPILAYYTAEILIGGMELARPAWTSLNACLSLAKNVAGALLLIYILRAGHWVVVTAPHWPAAALASAQVNFDLGMKLGLTITAFVLACLAVGDGWRLTRSRRIRPDGPMLGSEQPG